MAIKIKKKGRRDDESVNPLDEPDQFIQTADKSATWAVRNRQTVIAGLVAAGVAVAILAGGVFYIQNKAATMSDTLTDAVKVMRAPIGDARSPDAIASPVAPKDGEEKTGLRFDSVDAKYTELGAKADAVTAAYAGQPAADFANLIKARALHGQGKYAEAATLYKAWADAHAGAPEQAFVLQSLATSQAAAGQTDAAIASLESLKSLGEEAWGETAGYQMGRIYQEAGQKDKARAAYTGLLEKYPDSSRAELVKMHLDFL
jgi:predicted negative regulator of RcsB-dependent stress response